MLSNQFQCYINGKGFVYCDIIREEVLIFLFMESYPAFRRLQLMNGLYYYTFCVIFIG